MTNNPVNSITRRVLNGPAKKGVYSIEIGSGVQRILWLYFAGLSAGFSRARQRPRRVWHVASSKQVFIKKYTSYPQVFPHKKKYRKLYEKQPIKTITY
jgi:hypothetical protein